MPGPLVRPCVWNARMGGGWAAYCVLHAPSSRLPLATSRAISRRLLGTEKDFHKNYQNPILRGREPDASDKHRAAGDGNARCVLAQDVERRLVGERDLFGHTLEPDKAHQLHPGSSQN